MSTVVRSLVGLLVGTILLSVVPVAIASDTIDLGTTTKSLNEIGANFKIKELYDVNKYVAIKPVYGVASYFKVKETYDVREYSNVKPIYEVGSYYRTKDLFVVGGYLPEKSMVTLGTAKKSTVEL